MNELYHFGIRGMKWGVRRYQKEDGSYTSQGRGRYDNGSIFSKHYARKSEKYSNKAKENDKKIKMLSKYKNKALRDKDGNVIADNKKIKSSIKGYEKIRDKNKYKADYYKRKAKGEKSDKDLKSLINKGYRDSAAGQKQHEERMRKLKKAAKIGAGVAAAGLAAYGGYKLHGAVKAANRKVIARDLANSLKSTKAHFDDQIKNGPAYAREMNQKSKERTIEMLYEQAQSKMDNDSFLTALKQVNRDRKMRKKMRHDNFYYGDQELYHFGVVGMRWGVRHDRTSSGSSHGSSTRTRKARTDNDTERKAKIKKALKVGAAVTAAGLALYGAYKLGQTGSYGKHVAKKSAMLLTDSQHKKKTFRDALKKGVKREFDRDIKESSRISGGAKKAYNIGKRAVKAGKQGLKEGLEKGVRASGTVIGTGAVMGATEYLLKKRLGEETGGKVFSYGRQPIKKK